MSEITPSTSSSGRRITIFDTTLRDGEQSPGCSMNLDREAGGRPGAGRPGRRRHRSRLSHRLARRLRSGARDRQTHSRRRRSAAWPAATTTTSTAPGKRSKARRVARIHVFLATSAIHREFKLKMEQGGDHRAGRRRREARRAATATTSSSRPKTPPAPSPISSARSSKRRSTPAPRPSTFPTRSATPRRRTTAA